MSKIPLPLSIGDISSFAKSLRCSLDGLNKTPSHVEMLNLLTKAAGYRNFQHFKARSETESAHGEDTHAPTIAEEPNLAVTVDDKLLKRLVRFFDDQGCLIRWPGKYSQRVLCLWAMWAKIPARTTFSETEISNLLDKEHLFGDYALLRRELIDRKMVERTPDGREYKRCEVRPPAEAIALLERLRIKAEASL